MSDQQPLSAPAAFFATLWGKVLAVLAAITMILGIYIEIIQAWRGTNEAIISSQQAKVAPQMQPAAAAATVADAQIKEATAQEALRRQKAEADEAVARACNARMEQLKQNAYSEDISANGSVKPGSRTARMLEVYEKDCVRPTTTADSARVEIAACDAKFKALLDEFDPDRVAEFRAGCEMTEARLQEVAAKLKATEEAAKALRDKVRSALAAQRWPDAYELSVLYAKAAAAYERSRPGLFTTEALTQQALSALFTRQFEAALSAAERVYAITHASQFDAALSAANRPVALKHISFARLLQADALLFLARPDEAISLFRAGVNGTSPAQWNQSLSENLETLRALRLPQPVISEIEAALGLPAKKTDATEPLPGSAPARALGDAARPPTTTTVVESRPDSLAAINPAPDPNIEAVRRYKVASDRGDADAQWQLGLMYEGGRGGLATDPLEAARLYKLSAEQGYAAAQVQLAYMYEKGDVLPKNLTEAARLYRLAANQGNADGQANLADFYERGDAGLRKDACEAMRLRKLAAAQGNTYAAKALNAANATRCKN